jgi:predicted nucleotidyltransferase
MTTNFHELLQALVTTNVEFIIVGGAAATAHGSARLTEDLDIVYRRTPENIEHMIAALLPYDPYLRGAPPGLPFKWDKRTIWNGLNFTLITALGAIDFLGEIIGGGNYDDLLPHSIELQVFGLNCLCLGLERLIYVKRAAGRPKDFEAIAELEAILEERRQKP